MRKYKKLRNEKFAECPYCWHENEADIDLSDPAHSKEFKCKECGSMFYLRTTLMPVFTSIPDCELKGIQHDWVTFGMFSFCNTCGKWKKLD